MKRRKIAIVGSTGQLGTDLSEVLREDDRFDVIPLSHQDADCTKTNEVQSVLLKLHPDAVINCAAYVRVDECEDHAREAFEVNAIGALNIARACAAADALCVYVSTDYVFDGAKGMPYIESDPTCPINVYGASKLAGEHLVQQTAPRCLIVRMASLFGKTGARGKGGNFIETVLRRVKASEPLRVVNDVTMSPTYARDASEALALALRDEMTGPLHLTNGGACTWYEFAEAVLDFTGFGAPVVPVSSKALPMPARRPHNSALKSERPFRELRQWQDALEAYLIEKGHVTRGIV